MDADGQAAAASLAEELDVAMTGPPPEVVEAFQDEEQFLEHFEGPELHPEGDDEVSGMEVAPEGTVTIPMEVVQEPRTTPPEAEVRDKGQDPRGVPPKSPPSVTGGIPEVPEPPAVLGAAIPGSSGMTPDQQG